MSSYPTLNFDLGDTADLLRDTVKTFARAEIAPRRLILTAKIISYGSLAEDGDLGLHGITFPRSLAAPV